VIKPGYRPRLSTRPFDGEVPSIAGKRREPNPPSILRKPPPERQAPLQPKGPIITERFDIAKDDELQKRKKFSLKSVHRLGQHMAKNRRRSTTAAASIQDPWEVAFDGTHKGDETAREEKLRQAVMAEKGRKKTTKAVKMKAKARAA
jgi:hypothetical protein